MLHIHSVYGHHAITVAVGLGQLCPGAKAVSSAKGSAVFNYSMLFLSYRFSSIAEESLWKSTVLVIFVCQHRSVQFFVWNGDL